MDDAGPRAPSAGADSSLVTGVVRRFLPMLGAIVLAGLALRVVAVLVVEERHAYGYDAGFYNAAANRLADGHGYSIGCPWSREWTTDCTPKATAYFPPGYSTVLAFASLMGARSLLAHQLASCVLGALAVALTGLLGRALGGDRVGLVAAAVAAVSPAMLGADVALMSESLALPLAALVLLLATGAMRKPAWRRWAVVGLAAGALALTRSDTLVFGALVLAGALLLRDADWRRRMGFLAVGVAGVLVVITPWILRNEERMGAPALSLNVGHTIGGANCAPTYSGDRLGGWVFACVSDAPRVAGRYAERDHSNNLRDDGLDYAADHPARVPLVAGLRVLRTWGLYAPLQQLHFEENEGRHFALAVFGWLFDLALIVLAIPGAWRLRRRGVPIWPIVAAVAAVVVVSALTNGNQRLRAVAEPALVAAAAVTIVDWLSQRRWPWRPRSEPAQATH